MNPLAPPVKEVTYQPAGHWLDAPCALVFFAYCNFRCPWCNAVGLVEQPHTLETLSPEEVLFRLQALKREHPALSSVCFTGGEPSMHRGLPALIRQARDLGFAAGLETNGSQPDLLDYLITNGIINNILFDLKAPLDDESYSRAAGVYVPASLIGESLDVVRKLGPKALIRATAVPGFTGEREIAAMAGQLRDKGFDRLALHAFDPAGTLDPGMSGVRPYSNQEMKRLQDAADAIFFPAP